MIASLNSMKLCHLRSFVEIQIPRSFSMDHRIFSGGWCSAENRYGGRNAALRRHGEWWRVVLCWWHIINIEWREKMIEEFRKTWLFCYCISLNFSTSFLHRIVVYPCVYHKRKKFDWSNQMTGEIQTRTRIPVEAIRILPRLTNLVQEPKRALETVCENVKKNWTKFWFVFVSSDIRSIRLYFSFYINHDGRCSWL